MKKNILLPAAFLFDVYRLLITLNYADLDGCAQSLYLSLEARIMGKLDAMDRRDSYVKYKTAEKGSVERELYRRDYLDKADIHKDWVSDDEVSFFPN